MIKTTKMTAVLLALAALTGAAFADDLAAAKQRNAKKWVGKTRLSGTEIQKDEFLSAAVKFADTAVNYGRDVYGPKHTPMFVTYLTHP